MAESSSNLSAADRMLIEHQCHRLCMEYARLVDTFDQRFADLFTPDATLILFGTEDHGHAEILDFIQTLPRDKQTLHLTGNVVIDVISETEARGTMDMLYYNAGLTGANGMATPPLIAPMAVGVYHDIYALTAQGWRIARREFKVRMLARPA